MRCCYSFNKAFVSYKFFIIETFRSLYPGSWEWWWEYIISFKGYIVLISLSMLLKDFKICNCHISPYVAPYVVLFIEIIYSNTASLRFTGYDTCRKKALHINDPNVIKITEKWTNNFTLSTNDFIITPKNTV